MRLKSIIKMTAYLCLFAASHLLAQNIIVVDSYNATYPWSATSRQGFNENIASQHQLTYFELNSKRTSESQYAKKAKEILNEIKTIKPDLVVTMDDNALKYLGQSITDANLPLVFMGVNNDPRVYFSGNKIPERVTGVMERPLLLQNITVISKLLPMTHGRILLIMDDGTTSTSFFESALDNRKHIHVEGIDLDVFITGDFNQWKSKIHSLSSSEYDAVLVGSFSTMQKQTELKITDSMIMEWTSENSPIPIFTFWSHRTGKGKAIGGLVISGYEQGRNAANIANTILKQEDIFPLVEISNKGDLIFSKSELFRWDITLPSFMKKRSSFVE